MAFLHHTFRPDGHLPFTGTAKNLCPQSRLLAASCRRLAFPAVKCAKRVQKKSNGKHSFVIKIAHNPHD
ncbi:hypothetical protein ACGTZG_06685 [Megasphaera hexanoica]|uniref:Uncharacterized protein n=1 Tax=Megasphaera hexanoica TaxID=1675036 RepID=A0ABW7DNC5_9FIRM